MIKISQHLVMIKISQHLVMIKISGSNWYID